MGCVSFVSLWQRHVLMQTSLGLSVPATHTRATLSALSRTEAAGQRDLADERLLQKEWGDQIKLLTNWSFEYAESSFGPYAPCWPSCNLKASSFYDDFVLAGKKSSFLQEEASSEHPLAS